MSVSEARIGADAPRIDAVEKVTGLQRYAADRRPDGLLHAVTVPATIARGRILAIDTTAAAAVPGVALVLTHDTMPALGSVQFIMAGGHAAQSILPMTSAEVHHHGQTIALVVAHRLETARGAARLVSVRYEAEPPVTTLDDPRAETLLQEQAIPLPMMRDRRNGDAEAALAGSTTVIDVAYATPAQHQNPIELLATVAVWQGDRLTIHEPSQNSGAVRAGLARVFGIDPAAIRVISPSVGGGFGQKNALGAHTVLAAVAARATGRPVKLVMPRAQVARIAAFRPAARHRIRLGAGADGRMTAAIHEITQQTSRHDLMPGLGTEVSLRLHAIPAVQGIERLTRLDTQTPGFMRAPYEFGAAFAFESAVDELAWELGADPVAFRLAHDTDRDPVSGKPFSSRHLAACLERGARAFGWHDRDPRPGRMRDAHGRMTGMGVAVGAYKAARAPAITRLTLRADGSAEIAVGGHEMGQGLRTVVALTLSDRLGIDPAAIRVIAGDTASVPQHLTAGSWGTATVVPSVAAAAEKMRSLIAERAGQGGLAAGLSRLLAGNGGRPLEVTVESLAPGQGQPALDRLRQGLPAAAGPDYPEAVAMSFVAHFVEVAVDPRTRILRVVRAHSVIDCGRVISARTARSQALGGMIWGIGGALFEASEVDPRDGSFLNADLAEYVVASHADIGRLSAEFIDLPDPMPGGPGLNGGGMKELGMKGLGEVASVGMPAAIANAVFHATGRRIRDLPIRVDALI